MMTLLKSFQLAFIFLSACSQSNTLAPAEFKQRIESSSEAVVLDVRTKEEVSTGVISGATVIDYNAGNFEEQISKLDKSKPYFVYCASGVRSGKAQKVMEKSGFEKVYTLEGGLRAWKDEGLPLKP